MTDAVIVEDVVGSWNELRCPNCHALQFKGRFMGYVEIKCRKCKQLVRTAVWPKQQEVISQ